MGFVHHDFHHLLSDKLDLRRFGIACGSDLFVSSLGESNAKHSEQVSVNSFGLHESFDGGVPFLHNGAELVSGDVHAVKVSVAIKSLHFFYLHLHLSPGEIIAVSIQISQRYLKHTTSQAVGGDLYIAWLTSRICYFDQQFCCMG